MAGKMCRPGVTTDEIDKAVHKMCVENECYPSPLNYRGFPKSVCTSVNEVRRWFGRSVGRWVGGWVGRWVGAWWSVCLWSSRA